MKVLNCLRKMISILLALAIIIGFSPVPVFAGGGSSVDLLDPDFIASHGGNIVEVNAEEGKSPFEVFGEKFGTDNPVEGVTKTVRDVRPTAQRHVRNYYDEDLGKYVFLVEAHDGTCADGCFMHNTSYNSETDTFSGGNTDRQRIEIRPVDEYNDTEFGDLVGLENDISAYSWKMKLDPNFPKPDGFFHIFQYKAVGSTGSDIANFPLHDSTNFPTFGSDEDGNPILTLTQSSSTLDFRWAEIGSDAGMEVLASVQTSRIKGKWVDITVKILNSECGWVTMVMKDSQTGEILMEYDNPNKVLDMWRRPEIKYNGKTFESPLPAVANMFNRPKWGIYRKAQKGDPNVPEARMYLSDITLYKSVVGASPVNLAYGKKAYNIGSISMNILQYKNAVPSRLTDGVQQDPVIYPVTGLVGVTEENYSHLGGLCWVGQNSSKKGDVVIDLGQVMDFNQVKLFAKSLRMKNVDVSISDDPAEYTEENMSQITYTKLKTFTDGKENAFTFINSDSKSDDTQDAQYLIDLGKTYTARYVKFYFENGAGTTNITTMTGPPRISELEIYNAPQTPQNITVNYTTGSEAVISWDDIPADYFTIYDNGIIIADNVPSFSYTLANLDPGAVYNLTVKTVFTDPYSYKAMFSSEGIAPQFMTDGDPIIPNPPDSVTVTADSDKSINVTWEAVADAQGFRVSLITDACERTIVDNYEGTSYTIRDLSPGTEYTVKVYSIRRGTPSTQAAVDTVTTTGVKNASDNLLYNKEVQYSRVWNDNPSSYGGHRALDNDIDGSRYVALKGSPNAYLMVDIGETTPVQYLEYYSFQNMLKKVSFYYATDGEAFINPNSDKWIKIITVDRVAEGTFGNSEITKIAERIKIDTPINARYIKFTVDSTGGDINVNEVKAFGPISFTEESRLTASEITQKSARLDWTGAATTIPATGYKIYQDDIEMQLVTGDVFTLDVSNLKPATEYLFRVKGVATVNETPYETLGGLVCTVLTSPDAIDTEAPIWLDASLEASNIGTTAVTLTWTEATDNVWISGYKILYGNKIIEVQGNSYRILGLASNTSYTFTVQAVDAAGNISEGPAVTVRTLQESTNNNDQPSQPSAPTPKPSPVSIVEGSVVKAPKPVSGSENGVYKAKLDKMSIDNAFANIKDSSGKKTVSIEIPNVDGAKAYIAEFPIEYAIKKDSSVSLEIKTEFASVTIPGNMLDSASLEASSRIGIRIEAVNTSALPQDIQQKVGTRPIISLNALVDDKLIEFNNPDAPVTIRIPYTPSAEELLDPEHIVVWYIDGAGNVITVSNGKFDKETGTVVFTTTHFSRYAVAYVVKTFDDLGDCDWAKKPIEVLASKGIISGISDKAYAPARAITRGDFIRLLVNTLEFTADVKDNFNDVKPTDSFYNEVGIAKALGVVYGGGSNNFNPHAPISRQDMMVIIERALSLAGKLGISASISDLDQYADKDDISNYALVSIAKLVKDGLIQGSGGRINPQGHATRAQIAVILYNIYNR